MYPPEDNKPAEAEVGDMIEHRLMAGFRMKVEGLEPCATGPDRPEPHSAYKITDPEGNEDSLCAYDVRKVG